MFSLNTEKTWKAEMESESRFSESGRKPRGSSNVDGTLKSGCGHDGGDLECPPSHFYDEYDYSTWLLRMFWKTLADW